MIASLVNQSGERIIARLMYRAVRLHRAAVVCLAVSLVTGGMLLYGTATAEPQQQRTRKSRSDEPQRKRTTESRPWRQQKRKPRTLSEKQQRELNIRLEIERANRLIRERRYDQAIVILEVLCANYPEAVGAAERLSDTYLKARRPQEAVEFLENRLRGQQQKHMAFIKTLGLAYLDLGLKENAIEAWHRILTGDERSAPFYGIIAKLEQGAGMYDQAIATFREGRRFERHFAHYTMEIVRMERMRGRNESAFWEGLIFLTGSPAPSLNQASFLLDILRESPEIEERLLAMSDSIASAGSVHRRFFELLHTVLLVETGAYDEAALFLEADGGEAPDQKEYYGFINALSVMVHKQGDVGFDALFVRTLREFLKRYRNSPLCPAVLLVMAEYRWRAAHRSAPPDTAGIIHAIALADSAAHHPTGFPFRERAAIFTARLQLDDLYRPGEALKTLEAFKKWKGQTRHTIEELRIRAFLASREWPSARKRFKELTASRDSTIVVLGRYGTGMMQFLKGEYDEAVKELSELAERYSWSPWANDALETAVMIKSAMEEGKGALDLYRTASIKQGTGDFYEAIRSLDKLESSFEGSVLAPRAILLRADLEARVGRSADAEKDLVYLAEHYPLHELAPRALENLGDIAMNDRPGEAARRYGEIIERYPDDPFIERVRNKYIALKKNLDEEGERKEQLP
ncbi:MAG: tetratricopeptide repeat protein [bacterium]|nr:MAG: tetratricopeptide repeat protein [bacterium]